VTTDERHVQIQKLDMSLTNHTPEAREIEAIEEIRQMAKDLGEEIIMRSRPSREQSLALTKLEEVTMWAVKGVILNGAR
jgi:chaperonin cofactor prefoldin